MNSFGFPKTLRLLTKSDFYSLKGRSRRFVGRCLCIDFRPSSNGVSRLGITASGRYGDSCERNRFKRLVREVFRTTLGAASYELHVIPRQAAKTARASDIAAEFKQFYQSNPLR